MLARVAQPAPSIIQTEEVLVQAMLSVRIFSVIAELIYFLLRKYFYHKITLFNETKPQSHD